jgi:hypothetical protein
VLLDFTWFVLVCLLCFAYVRYNKKCYVQHNISFLIGSCQRRNNVLDGRLAKRVKGHFNISISHVPYIQGVSQYFYIPRTIYTRSKRKDYRVKKCTFKVYQKYTEIPKSL